MSLNDIIQTMFSFNNHREGNILIGLNRMIHSRLSNENHSPSIALIRVCQVSIEGHLHATFTSDQSGL